MFLFIVERFSLDNLKYLVGLIWSKFFDNLYRVSCSFNDDVVIDKLTVKKYAISHR